MGMEEGYYMQFDEGRSYQRSSHCHCKKKKAPIVYTKADRKADKKRKEEQDKKRRKVEKQHRKIAKGCIEAGTHRIIDKGGLFTGQERQFGMWWTMFEGKKTYKLALEYIGCPRYQDKWWRR